MDTQGLSNEVYQLVNAHFINIKKFTIEDAYGKPLQVVSHAMLVDNLQLFMDELDKVFEQCA